MVNFSGVEPTKIFAIRVLRRAVLSQSTKAREMFFLWERSL